MENLAKLLALELPHAYYVGGIVRNSLLKKQSGDIDIALPACEVKQAAQLLARKLKAVAFEMDAELGVWRLVTSQDKLQIDLTAFQGKNLEEDLRRRDFTVNALAYPVTAPVAVVVAPQKEGNAQVILTRLRRKQIIDITGGQEDLRRKLIRLNGPKQFEDDPLRMLRAFRSAAELKFTITPNTLAQIKKNRLLISQPAGERIQEELNRLLAVPGVTYDFLCAMDQCGLLSALFSRLEDQRTCAEVYYGKGGVLKHTLLVCKRMDYLLGHLDKAFPQYAKKLEVYAAPKALFKLTALLHDIAKPATAKMKKNRLRFFYHEHVGAHMAQKLLKRLHYSRADIRLVHAMIFEHLRPSNLASNEGITERAIYHFFRDLGSAAIPLLFLCWADYTSYVSDEQLKKILPKSSRPMMTLVQAERMQNIGKTLRHLQLLHFMMSRFFDQPSSVKPVKIVTGLDVMQTLKVKPGPAVGAVLEAVAEAQVEGVVKTRQDALSFMRGLDVAALVKK